MATSASCILQSAHRQRDMSMPLAALLLRQHHLGHLSVAIPQITSACPSASSPTAIRSFQRHLIIIAVMALALDPASVLLSVRGARRLLL